MNLLRKIPVAVVASALALSLAPALAQDEEPGTLDDFSQFEGIESAVARTWSVDFEAMFSITPEAGEEDPFADMTGVFFLYGMAAEFDSDDNAEAAFEGISEVDDEELLGDMLEDGGEAQINREELDDLGDEGLAIDVAVEGEDGAAYRMNIVRDDEYLLVTMAVSMTEDGNESAENLMDYMVNEGEPGGDEEFEEDGGSTGGLWDLFPAGDEDYEGLVPAGDQVVYPVPEDEDEDA